MHDVEMRLLGVLLIVAAVVLFINTPRLATTYLASMYERFDRFGEGNGGAFQGLIVAVTLALVAICLFCDGIRRLVYP